MEEDELALIAFYEERKEESGVFCRFIY